MFVDYESPLACGVAEKVWAGLSVTALGVGYVKVTALWESLRSPRNLEGLDGLAIRVFAVGQDRPEAIDAVCASGDPETPHLYGVVVAIPDRPSPLAGSLLYQGVERLLGGGVKAGAVEPALLRALPKECESYARRLLERLSPLLEA